MSRGWVALSLCCSSGGLREQDRGGSSSGVHRAPSSNVPAANRASGLCPCAGMWAVRSGARGDDDAWTWIQCCLERLFAVRSTLVPGLGTGRRGMACHQLSAVTPCPGSERDAPTTASSAGWSRVRCGWFWFTSMRDAMKAGTQAPQTGVACVPRAGSAYDEMVWGAHRGFLYCVASRVLGRSAIARLRARGASCAACHTG